MKNVLIPSSSGQCFKHCKSLHSHLLVVVLIPSSSGQCFKRMHRPFSAWRSSLNPFFIRSMFQTDRLDEARTQLRLNPFFIRAMFQTGSSNHWTRWNRLNPFFIRAMFQTPLWPHISLQNAVLIPSSSGQCFKPIPAQRIPEKRQVLIPSSSGQCFKLRQHSQPAERFRS